MFGRKTKTVIPRISSFPEVSDPDIAFGGFPHKWFQNALEKAVSFGFDKINTKFPMKVSEIFFHGGQISHHKSLEESYVRSGFRLFQAILGSYKPKHEHKTAVCAFILYSLEASNRCPTIEIEKE